MLLRSRAATGICVRCVCSGCFERGVGYFGNDVHEVYDGSTGSAEECQALCQERADCYYFTYVSDNRTCHLKSSRGLGGRRETREAVLSGPKYCETVVPSLPSPDETDDSVTSPPPPPTSDESEPSSPPSPTAGELEPPTTCHPISEQFSPVLSGGFSPSRHLRRRGCLLFDVAALGCSWRKAGWSGLHGGVEGQWSDVGCPCPFY